MSKHWIRTWGRSHTEQAWNSVPPRKRKMRGSVTWNWYYVWCLIRGRW